MSAWKPKENWVHCVDHCKVEPEGNPEVPACC